MFPVNYLCLWTKREIACIPLVVPKAFSYSTRPPPSSPESLHPGHPPAKPRRPETVQRRPVSECRSQLFHWRCPEGGLRHEGPVELLRRLRRGPPPPAPSPCSQWRTILRCISKEYYFWYKVRFSNSSTKDIISQNTPLRVKTVARAYPWRYEETCLIPRTSEQGRRPCTGLRQVGDLPGARMPFLNDKYKSYRLSSSSILDYHLILIIFY